MHDSPPSALRKAVAVLVTLATASSALQIIPDDQHIPPGLDINTLANNSLFTRWRPTYHVAAPAGHMNGKWPQQ